MKVVMILLAMQTVVAFALTFRSISFNAWESNEGIRTGEDWLSLVTGGVFLAGAGLGWYGYSQHIPYWCWGLSGFRLCKLCLDLIGIGLVMFSFTLLKAKSTSCAETPDETGE